MGRRDCVVAVRPGTLAPGGVHMLSKVRIALAGIVFASGVAVAEIPPDCATLPERPPPVAAALASCVACHSQAKEGPGTIEEVDRALCLRSPSLVERMLLRGAGTIDDTTADVVRERQRELLGAKPPEFDFAAPRVKLSETDRFDVLPIGDRTDPGGYFFEWLKSRGAVFYDATAVPKARQIQPVSARMSVEDFFQTVFPRLDLRTNNKYADRGGLEFPWEKSAATDLAPSIRTFTFFVPPPTGPMAKTFRVARSHSEFYSEFVNEDDMLYGFTYLPGTAFLEVLTVPYEGRWLPIEVRLRAVDARGAWHFDILRPFPTRSSLATELHVRYPESRRPAGIAALLRETETPSMTSLRSLALADVLPSFWQARNSQATTVLEPQAAVHRLPPLDPATWVELLDRQPFRSAMGLTWLETSWKENALVGYSPESTEAVHFAPKGYFGSHLKTSSAQCVKCHSDTQYSVRRFSPAMGVLSTPGSTAAREWYGQMPGSTPQAGPYGLPASGVFSFHPFAKESLMSTVGQPKPVKFDPRLVGAGLLQVTDEAQ